ncbi:hypothetical protein D3C80_1763580 [compost metagenome]
MSSSGDVLDGADAHGAQREGHAKTFGRAGREYLAVGSLHASQTGRCQGHRHGDILAQQASLQVTRANVDRNALA